MDGTHWWSGRAWGDRTIQLLAYLKDGPEGYGTAEFVFGDCVAGSEHGHRKGWAHNPSLAPPARFLTEAQSLLGDCITTRPTYASWYQPDLLTSDASQFDRWAYNYANSYRSLLAPLPAGLDRKLVVRTSFRLRADSLVQHCNWSEKEAAAIIESRLEGVKSNLNKTAGEDWREELHQENTFLSEASWRSLMVNRHLPVGDAKPAYEELVAAVLAYLKRTSYGRYSSVAMLGYLSENPNTPAGHLQEAVELIDFTVKRKEPGAEKFAGLKRGIESHPNFPGTRGCFDEEITDLTDDELFDHFIGDSTTNRMANMSGFAAEALRNPDREDVLRRIIARSFKDSQQQDAPDFLIAHENLSLLLPAAGTILEEFGEALGDVAEEVPFEWLFLAAS